MKINWKARLANPLFYAQLFMGVCVPVLAYFGLAVEDVTSWELLGNTIIDALMNPYVFFTALVNTFGTVISFDSKGIGDKCE